MMSSPVVSFTSCVVWWTPLETFLLSWLAPSLETTVMVSIADIGAASRVPSPVDLEDLRQDGGLVELLVGLRLGGDTSGFRLAAGFRRPGLGVTAGGDDGGLGQAPGFTDRRLGSTARSVRGGVGLCCHPVALGDELAAREVDAGLDLRGLRGAAAFLELRVGLLDEAVLLGVGRLAHLGIELALAELRPPLRNLLLADDDLLLLFGLGEGAGGVGACLAGIGLFLQLGPADDQLLLREGDLLVGQGAGLLGSCIERASAIFALRSARAASGRPRFFR